MACYGDVLLVVCVFPKPTIELIRFMREGIVQLECSCCMIMKFGPKFSQSLCCFCREIDFMLAMHATGSNMSHTKHHAYRT